MSNAILRRRGEVAHWTKLPARLQVKARVLAASQGIPMNVLTGRLLSEAIERELAKFEKDPTKYAASRGKTAQTGEIAKPQDDLEPHWTKLLIKAQNDAKELAKAKGIRLNVFTGNLLTKMINEKFAQFLAEQNAAESQ